MGTCSHIAIISTVLCLSQIPLVKLQESCPNADRCPGANLVHIWYIWLAVALGGLLLLCGLATLCVRCCCLSCQATEGDARARPYEVTVIAFDPDSSTLHSTITSLSSAFGPAARRILAVAHSHSAIPTAHLSAGSETPPIYEEALRMSRFTVARSEERALDLEPGLEPRHPEGKGPKGNGS